MTLADTFAALWAERPIERMSIDELRLEIRRYQITLRAQEEAINRLRRLLDEADKLP